MAGASGWVEGTRGLLVKGRRPAWGSASAGLRTAGPAGCPGPSSQASVGRALEERAGLSLCRGGQGRCQQAYLLRVVKTDSLRSGSLSCHPAGVQTSSRFLHIVL